MYARLGAITKIEDDGDSVLIYGKATDGTVDSDEQEVDPAWAARAMAKWFNTAANVRQMHSTNLPPAGLGVQLDDQGGAGQFVKSRVVEPVAMRLVKAGVYKDYSIGIARPRIVRAQNPKARNGRIVDGEIVELSLVDRGSNYNSHFALAKMAGGGYVEYVGKFVGDLPKAEAADPAVGGGRVRSKIPRRDFVFPEDAPDGGFPVASPGDVSDAASSWGRYKGPHTFEEFKRRLIRLANRKGPAYVAQLPASWSGDGKVADIAKYSDDQARDDLGRFAPSGSGDNLPVSRPSPTIRGLPGPSPEPRIRVREHNYRGVDGHLVSGSHGHEVFVNGSREAADHVAGRMRAGREVTLEDLQGVPHVHDETPTYIGEKGALVKGGVTHTHTHIGPNGQPHKHEHTHAAGTPAHDELHEGGPHTHAHSTEDSVADDGTTAQDVTEEADAPKAAEADLTCDKCKGAKTVDGAECDKCHGTGTMGKGAGTIAKPEFVPSPVDDKAAAAPPADDAPEPDADDAPADGKKKPAFPGAAPPFGSKKPKGRKSKTAPPAADGDDTGNPFAKGAEPDEDDVDATAKRERKAARKAAQKAAASGLRIAGDEVPWVIRRAHDVACGVYATDALLSAYPSLTKNGVAQALGPAAQQAIYSMLASEVATDGGAGTGSFEVYHLAKGYAALSDFLSAEASEVDPSTIDSAYLAARAELHEAFKTANAAVFGSGDGPSIPAPTDTPRPAQFQRGYLTAGTQAETASSHDVSLHRPDQPISASDFKRGALGEAEGQERSFADKMSAFHDAIADWRPELCLMYRDVPDENGNFAAHRQPADSFARPPLAVQHLNTRPGSVPVPVNPPTPAIKGDIVPPSQPVITSLTAADIEAAVHKVADPLLTKIAALEASVDELGGQADPAQRADRGPAGQVKAATLAAGRQEAQRQAARAEKRATKRNERVEFYRGLAAAAGDAEVRNRAIDWLDRHGVDIEAVG